MKLRVNVQATWHEDRNSYNVLAELPGTDPSCVIGGHAWRAPRFMAHRHRRHGQRRRRRRRHGGVPDSEDLGLQPRRTLRSALWSGEEEGLLGSQAWVDRHLAGRGQSGRAIADDPSTSTSILARARSTAGISRTTTTHRADLRRVDGAVPDLGGREATSRSPSGTPTTSASRASACRDSIPSRTTSTTTCASITRTRTLFERVSETDLKQNAVGTGVVPLSRRHARRPCAVAAQDPMTSDRSLRPPRASRWRHVPDASADGRRWIVVPRAVDRAGADRHHRRVRRAKADA